ncbi:CHC2 zinc finger domain-containing protein [Rhodovulum sp. DZ06]|uniref:CHC2 zinc finger domain-containing protein n=1 Tax=Rhodovulum sp. DZ06 TaxID=3425126 RepID=UPI003D34C6C4
MSYDLDAIRAAIGFREVAEAGGVVWDMKKSSPRRGDWWAPCPFHDERSASFHIDERKGLFKCFGCDAGGDLFAFVMQRDGVDFATAARALAERGGIAREESEADRAARLERRRRVLEAREREAEAEGAQRYETARRIWSEARAPGPVLHGYLEARGVDVDAMLAALGGWPACLRYHPDLPYFEHPGGRPLVVHRGPAMIAAIGRDRRMRAIHRTWITETGRARFPDGGKLDKRIVGKPRRIFGAPIQFSRPSARMVVGEGIESTLAVWSRLLRRDGPLWSAEAAVSRGALCGGGVAEDPPRLNPHTGRPAPSPWPDRDSPAWEAPDAVTALVILAEGSAKDPLSAELLTRRAVLRHRQRPNGELRACTHRLPGGRWDRDIDFADLAAAEAARGRSSTELEGEAR